DYEMSQKYGSIVYNISDDIWLSGFTSGFGLGNVAQVDYDEYGSNWEETVRHETTHVGQQRAWGIIATYDLIAEQAIDIIHKLRTDRLGFVYNNPILMGLEYDAEYHEGFGGKDSPFLNLNEWSWWLW
ncbi:MAG: hypothetical protein PF518_18105, partial [Spirochaetaceae bacterium]|nr:hypothetical protein [Spirochaetaceae bacterium]